MKVVWIDCETTGLDPYKDCIIELACLYEEWENGENKNKKVFREYCLPEYKPNNFEEIEKLTGITWGLLEEKGLTQTELYNEFVKFLGNQIDKFDKGDKAIFAAYNAKFDNLFVRELFNRNGDQFFGSWFFSYPLDIASTVLTCLLTGAIDKPENFKNATVGKHLNVEGIDKADLHSALTDIKISRNIQLICQDKLKGIVKNERSI